MSRKHLQYLAILLLAFTLILSAVNVVLLLKNREQITNDVHNSIRETIKDEIEYRLKDTTPEEVTKVEYGPKPNDGKDGLDGKDSLSTHTIFKTEVIKEVPVPAKDGYTPQKGIDYTDGKDGLTPFLQCNTVKNRWEIRYSYDEAWVVVRDQDSLPVRCTI